MEDIDKSQAEYFLGKMYMDYPELEKLFIKAIKGEFINNNSANSEESNLYRVTKNNEELFTKYFQIIGYKLKVDDGFCYFTSTYNSIKDEGISSTDKPQINGIVQCLEIFNFLKTINNNFGTLRDMEFQISSIEDAVNNNSEFSMMIPDNKKNADTNRKHIENIINTLKKNGYVEEINKSEQKFKTLNSLQYLIDIVYRVDIEGES